MDRLTAETTISTQIPLGRSSFWYNQSNIQEQEGQPDAYHETTMQNGMELPSPELENPAGQGIGQPGQQGGFISPSFNGRSHKANIKEGRSLSELCYYISEAPRSYHESNSSVLSCSQHHPAGTPRPLAFVYVLHKVHTATCPLDKIILDFICSQRALVAKGFSTNVIVGQALPCLQAVLSPLAATDVHPISQVLAKLLSTFWNVALPEKLSFMFVMFRTMRVRIIASLVRFVRPI